ncbi:MAG: T9SS type A sorting domain-containing protein [Bacteroidales bacterium]|nr:T9SS type A sorting domain-containing protein [Bacteroidales bacterium]
MCTNLVKGQNIDPSTIVSVEFKTGAADQGIDYFPDLLFGVSGADVMEQLDYMGVNTLRIPVSTPMTQTVADILVSFIQDIYQNGGHDLSILLSQRKWDLYKTTQQEDWANDIASAFNAIEEAGYGNMVKGCIFDENRALNGSQSSIALWNERHNGVLEALDLLNAKTNNAFKARTVFIHGKGYGSQFLGVKASSDQLSFPAKMALRCTNYAYNFKYFQVGDPSDKSLSGWISHFKNYCCIKEVKELGIPMLFVGDAGDGLRPNSFIVNKNPYGGPGQHVIKALRDVFKEYEWSGFSIGPFVREGASQDLGQTTSFAANDGVLSERLGQTDSWWTWYNTTRSESTSIEVNSYTDQIKLYPNPVSCGYVNIKYEPVLRANGVKVFIYDISGVKVQSLEGNIQFLDVSMLKKGMYLVQFVIANDVIIKKLKVE